MSLRGLFDSLKLISVVFFGFGDLGGGDSVRTRNALHEVGAQSLEKRVTARLAQGYAGRQVAQTHHENHNLTFSISQ